MLCGPVFGYFSSVFVFKPVTVDASGVTSADLDSAAPDHVSALGAHVDIFPLASAFQQRGKQARGKMRCPCLLTSVN